MDLGCAARLGLLRRADLLLLQVRSIISPRKHGAGALTLDGFAASGSKLTFESRMGFPARDGRANLRDARWKIALRFLRRYSSAQSSGSRPQHAAEAGLAG